MVVNFGKVQFIMFGMGQTTQNIKTLWGMGKDVAS